MQPGNTCGKDAQMHLQQSVICSSWGDSWSTSPFHCCLAKNSISPSKRSKQYPRGKIRSFFFLSPANSQKTSNPRICYTLHVLSRSHPLPTPQPHCYHHSHFQSKKIEAEKSKCLADDHTEGEPPGYDSKLDSTPDVSLGGPGAWDHGELFPLFQSPLALSVSSMVMLQLGGQQQPVWCSRQVPSGLAQVTGI